MSKVISSKFKGVEWAMQQINIKDKRIEELEAQLEKVRGLPEEWANNTKHMKFKGHQQARQEAWNCISDLQQALEQQSSGGDL